MDTVEADKIASNLEAYLEKVQNGEAFVIAIRNQPVVELRPTEKGATTPRPFGLCKGEFRVPDDFDAPLPHELLADFEAQ